MSGERCDRFAEQARRLSELGWVLTPLKGKDAYLSRWQTTQPAEPGFAAGRAASWGRDGHNMGVVLGPSGLDCVEYDTPEAGEKLLGELLGGELPITPIVVSGSGRLHLYFAASGLPRTQLEGMDLRAGAHLCAVPPSVHPQTGREYCWLRGHEPWAVGLQPVPAVIVDSFAAKAGATSHRAEPVGEIVSEGFRHVALVSLAGSMRRRGLTHEEIEPSLLEVNRRRCQPPLPECEVRAIAKDLAQRYEPGAPLRPRQGGQPASADPELDERRLQYLTALLGCHDA